MWCHLYISSKLCVLSSNLALWSLSQCQVACKISIWAGGSGKCFLPGCSKILRLFSQKQVDVWHEFVIVCAWTKTYSFAEEQKLNPYLCWCLPVFWLGLLSPHERYPDQSIHPSWPKIHCSVKASVSGITPHLVERQPNCVKDPSQ